MSRLSGEDWYKGATAGSMVRTVTVALFCADLGAYCSTTRVRCEAVELAIWAARSGSALDTEISMTTVSLGVDTDTCFASCCALRSRSRSSMTPSSTAGDVASIPKDSIWFDV